MLLLEQYEPIKQKQIEEMYVLLFETELAKHIDTNARSPHPVWVFRTLHEIIPVKLGNTPTTMNYTGEVHILKNQQDENLWIFKPEDGEVEKGLKGILLREGAIREHVASILNYDRFFPIPFTAYVTLQIKGENSESIEKTGSIQQFVDGKHFHDEELERKASDMITESNSNVESFIYKQLDAEQASRLVIFDLLFSNTDRETQNILIEIVNQDFKIYGIDNAGILTASTNDEINIFLKDLNIDWLTIEDMTDFIEDENRFEEYKNILTAHLMPEEAREWMNVCIQFLKKCLDEHGHLSVPIVATLLINNRKRLMDTGPKKRDAVMQEILNGEQGTNL
jgi:hypothetical protein